MLRVMTQREYEALEKRKYAEIYLQQKYDELDERGLYILDKFYHDTINPRWKNIIIDNIITDYEVSNVGQVRNRITGLKLKQQDDRKGYKRLNISVRGINKGSLVHRLVAKAFISNPKNKAQVNHINGVKHFNWIGNLEWNTAQENVRHAWLTGLCTYRYGQDANASIYTDDQIRWVCQLLEEDCFTNLRISGITGVDPDTVSKVKCREEWHDISRDFCFPHPPSNPFGENHAGSKYTEKQITLVCELLTEASNAISDISRVTGVSIDMIWRIKNGLNWCHISGNYDKPVSIRNHDIDDVHDICKRLSMGHTVSQIVKDANIDRKFVMRIANNEDYKFIKSQYYIPEPKIGRPFTHDIKEVHQICQLLEIGEMTNKQIAERVGVLPGFVSSIKQRTHYTDISNNYDFKTASKEDPKNSVLTEPQVHESCKRMEKGESAASIAKDMGVSQSCINALRQGSWGHITSQYNIQFDHTNGSVNSRETAIKVCELLSQNKYKNTEIARMLNVKASFVSDIKQRKQWKDVGENFTWHLPSKPRVNVVKATVVKPGDVNPAIPVVKARLVDVS